jgi:prolyl-tRNA synthetase
MKMSLLLGERFKERPSEAMLESHAFLLRGGYMRQVAGGIFSLLPPAKRISQKIVLLLFTMR